MKNLFKLIVDNYRLLAALLVIGIGIVAWSLDWGGMSKIKYNRSAFNVTRETLNLPKESTGSVEYAPSPLRVTKVDPDAKIIQTYSNIFPVTIYFSGGVVFESIKVSVSPAFDFDLSRTGYGPSAVALYPKVPWTSGVTYTIKIEAAEAMEDLNNKLKEPYTHTFKLEQGPVQPHD